MRLRLAAATLVERHSWEYGVRSVSDGFGGGRCGGGAPAQGRAEGPTAQKGRSPWRRRGFADDGQPRKNCGKLPSETKRGITTLYSIGGGKLCWQAGLFC